MAESLPVQEPPTAQDKPKELKQGNPKDIVTEIPNEGQATEASGHEAAGDGRRGGKAWKKDRRGGGRRGGGWRDQPYHFDPEERRSSYGGRGGWRGERRSGDRYERRTEPKAEDLQAQSLAQKDDKVISFDCRLRPRSELTGWLRYYKPSELKRSNKIGYVAVLSAGCNSIVENKLVSHLHLGQ